MSVKRHLRIRASVMAFCGSAASLWVLYILNDVLVKATEEDATHTTSMMVARLPPTKKIESAPKPRPKKNKKSEAPRAPLPEITGGIASSSLGLMNEDWLSRDEFSKDMLSAMKDMTMTSDTVDEKPALKQRGSFVYPAWARDRGLEGRVTVNMLINQQGRIETTQVLESEPSGVFDETVLTMLKAWVFVPARYQGKAVRVWSKQTVRFDLGERHGPF